jgi:hypothetical protein
MEAVIKIIEGIATGGTTANIIKGVLAVGLLVVIFFFKRWLKNIEVKRANKNTQNRRNQNQTEIDQEAQDIAQDATRSEQDVDDFLED